MRLYSSSVPCKIGYVDYGDELHPGYMPWAYRMDCRGPIFPGPPQPVPEAEAHDGLWYLTSRGRRRDLPDDEVRGLCDEARRLRAPGLALDEVRPESLRHLRDLSDLRMLNITSRHLGDEGMHVLSGLRGLEWLSLSHTSVSDVTLVHLRGLPRLRYLDLSATRVTGAGLPHLAELPALADLHLYQCQIEDQSLVLLGEVPALRRLDLSIAKRSDVALAAVGALTGLEVLQVGCAEATGHGLRHLEGLTGLRWLSISGMREVLGHLRRLRHLPLQALDLSNAELRRDSLEGLFGSTVQALGLFGVKTDDAMFKHLGGLPHLRRFCLHGHDSQVTGSAMTYLALCTELEELRLDSMKIGDAGLLRLAGLRRLRRLDLARTPVSEDSLRVVAGFTTLREVSLLVCDLYEDSLAYLAALPHLERLELGAYNSDAPWRKRPPPDPWDPPRPPPESEEPSFHWLTDHGMRHIGALRGLRWLSVPFSYVTDDGLRHLRGLRQLERLKLGGLFTGPGLRHLAGLAHLHDLDLGCSPLCGRFLGPLVKLPRLTRLVLRQTLVDDEGLRRHVSRMKGLRSLSVDRAPVTVAGLRHVAALPDLESIWVRDRRLDLAGLRALEAAHPMVSISPTADELEQDMKRYGFEERALV